MISFVCFALILLVNVNAFSPSVSKSTRLYINKSRFLKAQGSDIVFTEVKILSNDVEATELKSITIEVPESLKSEYKTPGQYVQIKIGDGKPGFYAIASPPDSPSNKMSFLIKETENNGWFTSLNSGASVEMSPPMGKGFQIEENFDQYKFDFPTMRVVMMATGSGIAPIASAIDSDLLKLKEVGYNSLFEREAVLYIGARTSKHIPFQSKFAGWEKKGVKVVPVLSQPDSDWNGRTGYIQDVLKEDGVQVPRNTGVLLCGQRGMVEDSKETLLSEGCFEGRLLLNF